MPKHVSQGRSGSQLTSGYRENQTEEKTRQNFKQNSNSAGLNKTICLQRLKSSDFPA